MNTAIIANPIEACANALEHFALEECVKRSRFNHSVSALVTPAGNCDTAFKLAHVGAQVIVGDQSERRQEIEGRILARGLREEIRFAEFTLGQSVDTLAGEPFDIIVVRRGLCVLPYAEAQNVLRRLLKKLKIGGKLYVSVLGLHSELGDNYPASDTLITERFAPLAPAMAEKYGLHTPLCLYSERNLFMLLLEVGASVLRTLTTTYGNVQGIAVRV